MEPINVASLITDDIADQSAEAANALIKQDGWTIVGALARSLVEGLNATALVTLPVSVNLTKYKAAVTDPEGFEAKYNTLRKDVAAVSQAFVALHQKHEGRTGTPTEDELDLVNLLTLGYTKIQGHLESAIHPLMLNLVSELETAGITELTVEDATNE